MIGGGRGGSARLNDWDRFDDSSEGASPSTADPRLPDGCYPSKSALKEPLLA
jgi:hypothetical protein